MKTLKTFNEVVQNENSVIAKKIIPADAIFFEGHYPQNPIFPGVLQIELAFQAASLLCKWEVKSPTVNKFRFLKKVSPLDTLVIKVQVKEQLQGSMVTSVNLFVKEQKVAGGTLTFMENANECREKSSSSYEESLSKDYDMCAILDVLPHRYPFLHVDRILDIIPGKKITTLKNITASDYVYWGRETGAAFPETIMIEALAQSAAILGIQQFKTPGVPLFGSVSGAVFYRNVYPGDQLIMEAYVEKVVSNSGVIRGKISAGNHVVCTIESLIYTVAENE